MRTPPGYPRLSIRLHFTPGEMLGTGKAELLERIDRTGSIAAAGREMNMSYRRAWQLVETMNAMFAEPVVTSIRGGPRGGGAVVTGAGKAVIAAFRRLEAAAGRAAAGEVASLTEMLGDVPDGK